MTKMYGKIKWYKVKLGYGYITGGDNESYYFEMESLMDKDYIPKENDIVKFIPHEEDICYATKIEESKM